MKKTTKKIVLAKDLIRLFPQRESFLGRADITVIPAAMNDDVLRICSTEDIDLVVSKLDMPGLKCEDLFETIREDPKMQRVSIIIVCQDTLAQRERSKHCRANAVFTMPVDELQLERKMQQFLDIAPRIVYRATLAVAIEGKFRGQPLPFYTENISESGLLIKAAEPLSRGEGVFLSFFLHDGTHVTGYGEIVRVDRLPEDAGMFLYGIRFTNIDQESRAAIRKDVARVNRGGDAAR